MKNSLKLFVGAIILLLCEPTQAETNFGFGASLNSIQERAGYVNVISRGLVYFPIKIGTTFMLEPYLIYYDRSRESSDSTTTGLGIGGFYVRPINDSFNNYFGARLATFETESKSSFSSEKEDAVQISPLAGIEYSIEKWIYIAVEAGIAFSDGTNEDSFSSTSEDVKTTDTFTNIMLRMYF